MTRVPRPTALLLAAAAAALTLAGQARSQAPDAPAAAAPAAAAPAAAAPARPRPALVRGTLSNGLRLFCRTNDASEIVSIVCLVQAGLGDEREDQAGLAALTAEALLKGTTLHPGESFGRAVAGAGGNLQAVPGFDFTEIAVIAGREQFEPAMKLIAAVVAHPAFEPGAVNEAREALKRRAAGLQDDFNSSSYQALLGQLHPNTPYGRPITGYAQTLDRLTPADVRRFWQTNYVQNRIVVSVVGDVDAARALSLAQKAFQDVPFVPAPAAARPPRETIQQPRVELLQRPGSAAQVMVGFLAPPAAREGYPALAVLDAVIGGGKRARLFSNIREAHNLGYDLGSFYQPLLHQSHLVGYVVAPPFRRNPRTEQVEGVIDLVRAHLLEQYRQLAADGPTDQELARARAYVVGRYALRQERTRDQAKWLAWNAAMGLGPDFDQFFAERVPRVTKEQVQAAAKGVVNGYALVVTMPSER